MSALLQRVEGVVPCLTKPSFSRHPNPKFQHSPRILHAAFCSVYYKILLSVHLQACISGDISDKHTLSKAPPPHPRFSSDNPSYRYQPLRFCLSAIPTCRYLPLLDIAIHALHNARYQKLGRAETRSGVAISGMHEQNMQSVCAYHPPCCRGVPRIFLTASYAAIALDHL
jgi:hypothetical protein